MTVRANASLTELAVHATTIGTLVAESAAVYASLNPDVTLGELQPKIQRVALVALGSMILARTAKAVIGPKDPHVKTIAQAGASERNVVQKKQAGSFAPLILIGGALTGVGLFAYFRNT